MMNVAKLLRLAARPWLRTASVSSWTTSTSTPVSSWHHRQFSTGNVAYDKNIVKGSPLPPVTNVPIQDYIFETLQKHGDRQLFICGLTERAYTGAQITAMSHSFGAALIHHGVKKGDIIDVLLPNLPEYPIVMLGIWLAGGVVAPVSTMTTEDELIRRFSITQSKIIVTMPFFMNLVKSVVGPRAPHLKSIIDVDPFENDAAPDTHSFFEMVKTVSKGVDFKTGRTVDTKNDIAILPFSSGTTGPPKAVMVTHSGLCANAAQYLQPGVGILSGHSNERVLGLLPFYHCFGFCALCLIPMIQGSVVCTLPNFDPLSYVAAIRTHKPTVLHVVTPLVQFIVAFPEFTKKDFPDLHTVISGAAPAGRRLIKAFLDKVGDKVFFQEGYGMTEATCFTHIANEKYKQDSSKIGSIGLTVSGTECKVVDVETGESCSVKKPGELWIKGPQLMKGYYKNESATRDTFTPDGWLKTGDVALYDEDKCFYIVDRIKELIKVKGLQVSPSELEDLLKSSPDILDVAVVGVPHDKLGEAPRAFIVKKNEKLTEAKVHDFLERKIAPHKKLAGGVEFIDAVPRAPSGKILRRVLVPLSYKH